MSSKEVNEDYLSVRCVKSFDDSLQIFAEYGESAWGFDDIRIRRDGDKIYILGKLKFESLGSFKTTVKVPSDVNEVYFCSKKIWSRCP